MDMKQLEVQEVFSLDSYSVITASYGDSNYYIAGKHDITEYVKAAVASLGGPTKVSKQVLELGFDLFKRHNPNKVVLTVPQFDFIIHDDPTTRDDYVIELVMDLFHYTEDQAIAAVNELNGPTKTHFVGTFSEEMCITYGAMFENGNAQLKQNLGCDWVLNTNRQNSYEAAMQTLEALIRRDYPSDI